MLNAFIIGGITGLMMLIRPQSLSIIPFIVLTAWGVRRMAWKKIFLAALIMAGGIALSVFPWLYRNYQISGQFIFDWPAQTAHLLQRYSDNFDEYPSMLAGESEDEYLTRLRNTAKQYIRDNPLEVMHFMGSHFLNSEIDSVQVLPVRGNQAYNISSLFRIDDTFWLYWDERVTPKDSILFSFYLVMIGCGVVSAFRKMGWAALLPLAVNIGYTMSNMLGRNSGWRYVLPVDWISYLYFTIGLIQISRTVKRCFINRNNDINNNHDAINQTQESTGHARHRLYEFLLVGVLFVAIGSFVALSERFYPRLYDPETQEEIRREAIKSWKG